ncbi:hypothetical protein DESC_480079 [Desulfosarcina cetonica]|nr:hypothetical protein DESC_480079 [Desulfosarcina cetonica]
MLYTVGGRTSIIMSIGRLKGVFEHHETGHQENREGHRQKIEIAIDKPLDPRSEGIDQTAHQEETGRPGNHGGQDEDGEIDLEHAGGNGEDLIGNRGETGNAHRPGVIGVVQGFDIGHLVAQTVEFDDAVAHGRHELPTDQVPQTAAQDRSDGTDQGIAKSALRPGHTHGDQQDIGRNGKKGGFGKGQREDRPGSVRGGGPVQHPIVKTSQHSGFSPAVFTDEFDKTATAKMGLVDTLFITNQPDQVLAVAIAHRNDHSSAFGQLVDQHRGNFGRTGGDDDGVEGTVLPPTGGPVRIAGDDIVVAQFIEQFARARVQGVDALHGIDPEGDLSENGRLIAGTGANLQNPVLGRQLQGLGHLGDDERLGDGLLFTDGQGIVAIGLVHHGLADKQMTRDASHGVQHTRITDATGDDLIGDHLISHALVFHLGFLPVCVYQQIQVRSSG